MEDEMRSTALALPDEQNFRRDIAAINQFQKIVRSNLQDGHDFGVIPGTQKPTLLKPGAEKIAKLLGLADLYVILDKAEDWEKGFFRYLIKCSLVSVNNNVTISEGLGECNSMESKYRWRESKRKCPDCGAEAIIKGKAEFGGGWLCFKKTGGCGSKFPDNDISITEQTVGKVANDDIYTQVNTILKMAKKRALVDAALSAGRLSDLFTQDMEDIVGGLPEPAAKPADAAPIAKKAPIQAPEGMFAKGDTTPTEKDRTNKEDFVEACVKAGYSVQTKQGQQGIKAWMAKAGKTNLPFDELADEKQAELIRMMKCEELAE
jgi:ssDNA-binding Zn-finger/Zn-ribbon topoisomerase 1